MIDWAARERGCLRDISLKQSSCRSPIIWWMVYLPNRWGKTCIKIKLAALDVSWSQKTVGRNLNNTSEFTFREHVGNEFKLRLIFDYELCSLAHLLPHIVLWQERMGLLIMRNTLHTCVDFHFCKFSINTDHWRSWKILERPDICDELFGYSIHFAQRKSESHYHYGKIIISCTLFCLTGGPCIFIYTHTS